MSSLLTVVAITLVAGLATGLGALPVFARTRISHRLYDSALGLAAGIMFAAAVFALILPGLELGTPPQVLAGVLLGGGGLLVANRVIPHVHDAYNRRIRHGSRAETDPDDVDRIRSAALIGGAITLHNAPEGLAIGIAFASGFEEIGIMLAIVIGIQNIPDGFAFAVPVSTAGVPNWHVLVYTALSGAVPQVLASVVGFGLVSVVAGLFPLAAGFAAGAMVAVIFREMIPLSHGHGHADAATAAFLLGFGGILLADTMIPV